MEALSHTEPPVQGETSAAGTSVAGPRSRVVVPAIVDPPAPEDKVVLFGDCASPNNMRTGVLLRVDGDTATVRLTDVVGATEVAWPLAQLHRASEPRDAHQRATLVVQSPECMEGYAAVNALAKLAQLAKDGVAPDEERDRLAASLGALRDALRPLVDQSGDEALVQRLLEQSMRAYDAARGRGQSEALTRAVVDTVLRLKPVLGAQLSRRKKQIMAIGEFLGQEAAGGDTGPSERRFAEVADPRMLEELESAPDGPSALAASLEGEMRQAREAEEAAAAEAAVEGRVPVPLPAAPRRTGRASCAPPRLGVQVRHEHTQGVRHAYRPRLVCTHLLGLACR